MSSLPDAPSSGSSAAPAAAPAPAPERDMFTGEVEGAGGGARSAKLTALMESLRVKPWTADEQSRYLDAAEEERPNPLFLPRLSDSAARANEVASAVINSRYDEFDTPPALARASRGELAVAGSSSAAS